MATYGNYAAFEDWHFKFNAHTRECRTESTLKGIKQEPLNVTPYNGKAEYCRIIPSWCLDKGRQVLYKVIVFLDYSQGS